MLLNVLKGNTIWANMDQKVQDKFCTQSNRKLSADFQMEMTYFGSNYPAVQDLVPNVMDEH